MQRFGFIAEGPTDRAVLENILIGYFEDDISEYFTPLQPKQIDEIGGWSKVLNYCRTSDFSDAFKRLDFVVIQIDTDRSYELGFEVAHDDENREKISVENLITNVKAQFSTLFQTAHGDSFLPIFGHRILFAIAVHSTECWLLPLHYKNEKEQAEIKNCYIKLNKQVNGLKKEYNFYDKLSAPFRSPNRLKKSAETNPSFKIFIENELKLKIPQNTEGV